MKAVALLHENRREILEIARLNGVSRLSLFGSSVHGEDSEDSDIDFLVEFEEGRTLFDLVRLKQGLETLLGKSVDVVTENSVHPLLKELIKAEAVQI